MFGNGNGQWIHSYWTKGGAKVNLPKKGGWYAARPECCRMTVKVYVDTNLLYCIVEGSDMNYDVCDFSHWYPLKHRNDELPEFKE